MPATAVPTAPTVPVAALEGWTSCCAGAVTFSGDAMCCKGCWREVDVRVLDGDEAEALDAIVRSVITGERDADAGVAAQRDLLGWPLVGAGA